MWRPLTGVAAAGVMHGSGRAWTRASGGAHAVVCSLPHVTRRVRDNASERHARTPSFRAACARHNQRARPLTHSEPRHACSDFIAATSAQAHHDAHCWRPATPSTIRSGRHRSRPERRQDTGRAKACAWAALPSGGRLRQPSPVRTWVPAWPASMASIWSSEPITARWPVVKTKRHAASTFGPIEPAGNGCCASACGVM